LYAESNFKKVKDIEIETQMVVTRVVEGKVVGRNRLESTNLKLHRMNTDGEPGMVVHTCNSNTWEAQEGRS
jgi:hypothetical protein